MQIDTNTLPLAVVYRSVANLIPNPKNARAHSDKQIKQLAHSMNVFGNNVPILIDGANTVVAGHGRLLAARLLGLQEIPTITLTHLTPEQAKAFAIADNRLTENSTWDNKLLGETLRDLSAMDLDFSLEVTGFTIGEIDIRIEGLTEISDNMPDPADTLPDLTNTTPVSKQGDLWILGNHRLLCGSALEKNSYHLLMDGQSAAMVFTDPPYNVPIKGHVSGLGIVKHREFAMATGEMSEAEFTSFLTRACSLMARHSINGSIHFVCMDWRHARELLEAGSLAYTDLKNICVWAKDNGGMGALYRSQHEFVFVFKHGRAPHRNNVELGKHGRYRTNVWKYPGIQTLSKTTDEGNLLALHPTVKPVALVADAILDVSARGDIVLDPFLGSGTTLMAAERVGRICYGMELDPLYVDTIIRRWQNYTGGTALHAPSGKRFNEIFTQAEVQHVG